MTKHSNSFNVTFALNNNVSVYVQACDLKFLAIPPRKISSPWNVGLSLNMSLQGIFSFLWMAWAASSDQNNNSNNDFILVSMYLALRQLANWGHFPTYWHTNLLQDF